MGHRGALGTTPSDMRHLRQPLTRALQSSTIIGHQKCSCARASILVNTQSCCALTGRDQEGQHPLYLPLGHCTDIQQSLTQKQAVAYAKESMPLLHVYLIAQVFLQQGIPLLGWGVLVSFKPLPTGGQHCICYLGLPPIYHMHRHQLCSLHPHLIFWMHMLTQQFLVSFNLAPVYSTYNGTLQQGVNCLMVVAGWDSAEGISHSIIHPFLVFQGKLK